MLTNIDIKDYCNERKRKINQRYTEPFKCT